MDDLENPNTEGEMAAVRERNQREVNDAKKLRWWATEMDWILTLVVPLVVLVVWAILSRI